MFVKTIFNLKERLYEPTGHEKLTKLVITLLIYVLVKIKYNFLKVYIFKNCHTSINSVAMMSDAYF